MSEKEQFEKKQVYLWGKKQANKKLLKEYDKGDQHPMRRKKKEETGESKPKVIKVKEFSLDEDYGVDDLPFLNKEYERIDNLLSNETDLDESNRLSELQEKLYDLIEGLEALSKLQGRGFGMDKNTLDDEADEDDDYIFGGKIRHHAYEGGEPNGEDNMGYIFKKKGKGFKKGSPEALEHARKMREARMKKMEVKPIVKIETKARVIKGSEEAKELGRRLAEAKKKKAEEKPKKEPIVKEKSKKGKPYYYIGEIPKGYREATEQEAIKNKKVSEYGKYVVNHDMLKYFDEYGILLDPNATDLEIKIMLLVLKKKTLRALEDVEIFESKLDNEKYITRKEEFKNKLRTAKDQRKVYNAMFNFYYKLWCERNGKKYERIKIERPKIEFKEEKSEIIMPKKEIKIDPRTNKPIEERTIEEIEKGFTPDEKLFVRGKDEIIGLKSNYFDSHNKLISKYAERLFKKNIYLEEKFYHKEDLKKYFYHEQTEGKGIVFREPDTKLKRIIQSVIFEKNKWSVSNAKKWLKKHGYFNDDLDEKKNVYRFRQWNPESLEDKRYYITQKLGNGVLLIVSLKR